MAPEVDRTRAVTSSAARSAPPASLQLPGPDRPAPVTLASVSPNGSLSVPEDVSSLGWWVGSAPMGGRRGTTLVAGHVDAAEQGVGVFARLRELERGDELVVLDGLGRSHEFVVTAIVETGKAQLPPELFDARGRRRLALVTCAGEFSEQTRSYSDNLIVWADPR